jgi:hypothetical protein
MGNQIYFKIAGKKKKWIEGSNQIRKRGDEIKKNLL